MKLEKSYQKSIEVNLGGTSMVETTQRSHFECCYLMLEQGYRVLHAYDYKVEVTVRSMDKSLLLFKDLKQIIDSCIPHNSFLYFNSDTTGRSIGEYLHQLGISSKSYNCQINAENLVDSIAYDIKKSIDNVYNRTHVDVELLEVKLRETADSFVSCKYR